MNGAVCLITGANGFLGAEIVRQLAGTRLQIRATDKQAMSVFPDIDYRPADIFEPKNLLSIMQGADCIVHAAGLAHIFAKDKTASAPFKEINEIGTANVARSAAKSGVKHFILISSVAVYGPFTQGVHDENAPCHPQGPYAESKYQAERHAIEIAEASGMALTVLRLATLFGEGDPGNVARLIRMIDHGRFIWIGNGSNRKSLLHREDAARACLSVMQSPASGVMVYNVPVLPCTMREVVEGLAGALGKCIPAFAIPASFGRGISELFSILPVSRLQNLAATAQKWLAHDVYDGSKFTQAFNFQPRISLVEGLCREVVWYREEQARCGKSFKL